MGLFDFFSSKSPIDKHRARVADKRLQPADRWESIQAIGKVKSAEAVEALLPRFGVYADPSISDQEEKDEVFRLIVAVGEPAVDPVVGYLKRSESPGWAIKLLERLAGKERVVQELLSLVAEMDTEYERDPSRKIGALQALEQQHDPRIAQAVERFLADVSEPVRLHAVLALAANDREGAHRAALEAALAKEESVRIRSRISEVLASSKANAGT